MTTPHPRHQRDFSSMIHAAFEDQSHPCQSPGCPNTVTYDDEPFCFKHSPDSGSSVPGYSYARDTTKGEVSI